jgi:hypothetical protein
VSCLVPQLEGCLVVEREAVRRTRDKKKKKEEQEQERKINTNTEVRLVPNVVPKGSLQCSRRLRVWKGTRRSGLYERSQTA